MTLRRVTRELFRLPQYGLMAVIRIYQLVVSPLLGPRCKYYPSCSTYGLQAVRKHGAVRGTAMASWRVLRCNPWSNGGVDEVPDKGQPLFRTPQTSPVAT